MDHYFPETDKGKAIDLNNLTQEELNRRGFMKIKPEHIAEINETGISDLTGSNIHFISEANQVLKEIKSFDNIFDKIKNSTVIDTKKIYNDLKLRLDFLENNNPILFQDLINNSELKDRIDNFSKLEEQLVKSPNIDNYQEVEIIANKEKDV
jgi:hypothetical protein